MSTAYSGHTANPVSPLQGAPPGTPYGAWRQPSGTRGLSTALVVLLVGCAVAGIASSVAAWYRAGVIDDLLARTVVDDATLDRADLGSLLTTLFDGVCWVATAVLFIVWFWRMIKNAQVLHSSAAPNAGWAIGSWVIPLAQLVLPALFLARVDRISARPGRSARIWIIAWAVLFAVLNALERVAFRGGVDDPTRPDYLPALARMDRQEMWLAPVTVATAAAAILMITTMQRRQEAAFVDRAERHARSGEASALRRDAFPQPGAASYPSQLTPASSAAAPARWPPLPEQEGAASVAPAAQVRPRWPPLPDPQTPAE